MDPLFQFCPWMNQAFWLFAAFLSGGLTVGGIAYRAGRHDARLPLRPKQVRRL